jgi:hypothetical protein
LGANPISKDILADIKENEKYLGIDVNEIKDNKTYDFENKDKFMSSITNLKNAYQTKYSELMKKDNLINDEKETLLKLIEINREYGLNFSKNNSTTTNIKLNAPINNSNA